MEKPNLAVVLLAAGKSSRLDGKAKQLLKYKEETLLKIAVKKALELSKNVFVVLGYEKHRCQKEIEKFDIKVLYNENYEKGIGGSLSFGISHTKDFDNTMIMLCDQPFIPISHYELLKKSIDGKNIITSHYGTFPTVPAIFPKKYYQELLKLNEDKGAKYILQNSNTIDIQLKKEFSVDIDTLEDVNNFLNIYI